MKQILLALLIAFSGLPLLAQNWIEKKIVASDRSGADQFGTAVSTDGHFAIVGAPFDDTDVSGGDEKANAGSAYIFKRNENGMWEEVQKIVASDRDHGDLFGRAASISGNYAIVGAHVEEEDSSGGNTLENAGSAYLFERDSMDTWVEVQKIVASDREKDDRFGTSVSINGKYAIVGVTYNDPGGAAYIFERGQNGTWLETQKITSSDISTADNFGLSVSLSGDYAIVGAYLEDYDQLGGNKLLNPGAAYVFKRDTAGNWNQTQKIVASNRASEDNFGNSVFINGNYIIVGAPNRKRDIAGGNILNYSGAAYLYEKDSNDHWNEVQIVIASDRAELGQFGTSVAISKHFAVVGTRKRGAAYFFIVTIQPSLDLAPI